MMESVRDASDAAPAALHSAIQAHPGSCIVCAKAKSKCVRRSGSIACERRTAQLTHLETKLADIAQALTANQAHDPFNVSGVVTSAVCPTTESHTRALDHQSQLSPPVTTPSVTEFPNSIAQAGLGLSGLNPISKESTSPSMQEMETLFDRYQRLMSPYMPFALLNDSARASELAKSKPFLLQAIATVASFHNTARQQVMAKDLMRQISERMLISAEKSLDLLQGLLVFMNWYNPHLFTPPNHTVLLHLAMALTHDLNIDRAPGSCEKVALMAATKAHGVPQPAKSISNDERRAVLGTFYLTSLIFTSFRKVDTLNWTPWLTECVDVLAQAQEYESDALLVHLVQSQRIMQEAMSVKYDHAPVQFYAKSFLSDLEDLEPAPGSGTVATVARLQQACTRTAVWERSFADPTTSKINEKDLRQRLTGMWQCMEAAKDYIDIYLGVPVEEYLFVPFGIFAQFAYIFVVISRASSIEMDGWDVRALREFIDFSTLMEEASKRYDAVAQTRPDGLVLNNDAFAKWSAKTKWAKAFYDTKLLSTMPDTSQPRSTGISAHNTTTAQATRLIHPQLDTTSQTHLSTPPEAPTDNLLRAFTSLDDTFWAGFNDPLQFPGDLDLGFESL